VLIKITSKEANQVRLDATFIETHDLIDKSTLDEFHKATAFVVVVDDQMSLGGKAGRGFEADT
jgi:hypothetical protein